jgi:hypothetical protein
MTKDQTTKDRMTKDRVTKNQVFNFQRTNDPKTSDPKTNDQLSRHLAVPIFAATLFLLGVQIFAGAPIANATTLMRMSLAQMSRAATMIVRGRCAANETIWDEGEIWTRTTFEIAETWRGPSAASSAVRTGAAPPRIVVRLLGGSLASITSRVSGIPRFQPGEDVVLFLEPSARGDLSIVSWQQGTFRIRRSRQTAEETVTQDTAFFATYDPGTRSFDEGGIRRMPLANFRAQVAAALATNPSAADSAAPNWKRNP